MPPKRAAALKSTRSQTAAVGPNKPDKSSRPGRKPKANGVPKTSTKRKDSPEEPAQRPSKRTKAAQPRTTKKSKAARPPAPSKPLAVFVTGSGECGELGLGPKQTESLRPCVNPYLDPDRPSGFRVVQLSCGGMHTVALTADNQIITWGVNDNHALGRDTTWDGVYRDVDDASVDEEEEGELNPFESTPIAIPSNSFPPDTQFAQVAAGDSCSFALTVDGAVYGWGTFRNTSGDEQFGYDSNGKFIKCQKTPTLIAGLSNITQITCGANHALALDTNGLVWGWGSHEQNQLGRRLFGRHTEHLRPRRVEVCRGNARYIASGEYHSFAVDSKDRVWAWGLNSFGEAGYAKDAGGDSALLSYPVKIAALCGKGVSLLAGGAHHSAAVTEDGECLVWGRMDGGQLGIEFTPEQLSDEDTIRHDERGNPRICLRPTRVPHIGRAVHVACGTDHTVFVDGEGRAHTTGIGSSGQLGLGKDDDVDVAREVRGKDLKGRALIWAGAGGQFSVVAGR